MLRIGIASLLLLVFAAACGGGSSGGGGGGAELSNSDAATKLLALQFNVGFSRVQECLQAEIDGRSPCTTDFKDKDHRINALCADVKASKSAEFSGADFARFVPLCDGWDKFILSPTVKALPDITRLVEQSNTLR